MRQITTQARASALARGGDAYEPINIVIKTPMDLGTILKKVKAQQYKDKAAFKEDLDLIWENCYTYNTLPVCNGSSVGSVY